MEMTKQRENWIDITKFLACLMITNSHCRGIYPISFLAIGGGFGNALFFIVSGYLLANIRLDFIPWLKKRCGRVLPITLFFVVVNELISLGVNVRQENFREFISYYIDAYWFTFAIVIYYVIFYFIFSQTIKVIITSFFIWVVGYIILYICVLDTSVFAVELGGFAPFKVYFYFGIMLIGGIIRKKSMQIREKMYKKKRTLVITFFIIIVAFIGWTMEYAAVTVMNTAFEFQFLIHMFVFIFAITFIIFIWNVQLRENRIVTCIANSTLEIYLVQITFLKITSKPFFPINWILFWCVAIGGGVLTRSLMGKIGTKRGIK